MRVHWCRAPLILAALAAGCGGSSPSAPSTVKPPANASVAATQGIVGAVVTQATSGVITAAPDGSSRAFTHACPDVGSITTTTNVTTPPGSSGTMTLSTRTEFSDCRSQTVTINGDPYLTTAGEYVFVRGADGVLSSTTATIRMMGGLRFNAGATQGRARYDCTHVVSFRIVNGTPSQPSISSGGTITWEQPLGTVAVRPCGP